MESQLVYQIFESTIAIFETVIVYIFLEGLFLRNNSRRNIVKLYIAYNIGLVIFSLYFDAGLLQNFCVVKNYCSVLFCCNNDDSRNYCGVFTSKCLGDNITGNFNL